MHGPFFIAFVVILGIAALYDMHKRREQKLEVERGLRWMEECVKCAQLAGFRYDECREYTHPIYVLRGHGKYPLILSISLAGWHAWNPLGASTPWQFDRHGSSSAVSDFEALLDDYDRVRGRAALSSQTRVLG